MGTRDGGERGPHEKAREAGTPPSPEVLQVIRLLLSSDPKDEVRGELLLKRMGPAIAPQLRFWIRKVKSEADRVRLALEALEGRGAAGGGGADAGEPSAESLTVDEFFHRRLLEARALVRGGEHRRALDMAEAILLLDRSNPYAWDLRRLVRRAKERVISKEVLEPAVEVEKLVFEVGDRPEITFRLVNHGDGEATIQVQKGVLGELDTTVTRCFADGSTKLDRSKVRIQVPSEVERIVIAPGKAWEHRILLDPGADVPIAGAVARVQIGGKFRPSRWKAGGIEENLGLALRAAEIWMVPPGQGPGSDRPLEKLAAALVFGNLEAFFVGGQLCVWAGEEDSHFNEKFIGTLMANIEELDPRRLELAARFLNESTGQDLAADAARWKAWWMGAQK